MWLRFYIVENGVSIIDSIQHCLTENALKTGKIVNYASFLYRRKKLEYLSSLVFHTVILKCSEKGAKARNVASFLYSGKMEYLSSIVFHTVILKML